MESRNFVRLANYRDDLLMQRSQWADEQEFLIFQRLRIEAQSIIADGCIDFAFVSWRSKEHAAGRRYDSESAARSAYKAGAH